MKNSHYDRKTLSIWSEQSICDATVRFRATPPAFRLIRKILQSGSLVNVFMAFPFSLVFMAPLSWTHMMPDYQIILNISSGQAWLQEDH
jgi:hypothetical protein